MQPSPGSDVTRGTHGEAQDEGDSLRLVKIRLALTLIAVAILPIAIVAPIARAVLDGTRTGLEERLGAEADHAAAEFRRELTGIGGAIENLAMDAAVADAVGQPPADPDAPAGIAGLGALVQRPSGIVAAVGILDPAGAVHARVGSDATAFAGLAPPPSSRAQYLLVPDSLGGVAALEIAASIPAAADGPPVGSVVASINLTGLVAWASPAAASAERTVQLVDPDGRVLAVVEPGASINLPGAVIDMAANGSERSEGVAPIGLPQLEGWRVIATAPMPVTELPLPAIAALFGLIALLVAFIWWMARQILRPTAELDARRARLHRLYEDAKEASLRDSLTGLGNHRAFQEAVERMVDHTRRYRSPFSLILLDVDDFKRVNDTRGHATGDLLLTEVGDLIRSTVRHADAGYRIGGDEFAIILPSTDAIGAETTARRLLTRGLEDRPAGQYRGPISFTAGLSACPELGSTRIELTAQADAALYRGKRSGRTVVNTFDPALDRGHVDEGMRSELSAAVAIVIETGVLSPVYQPIVELANGEIIGYEGLVRAGAEGGFPNTGALFDAAEVAGRVLDLDRASLDVVLRGARRLPASTLVSLNVSPRSFEVPEFNASIFLAILRRHGMAPERVILELTEREAIRDPERIRSAITLLQAAGVRVAADDVGAGNAGLRLLSQFRFDVVKIDLSLVQGGPSQTETLSVVTSLVQLARRWGALTVAEGVETGAQLQMIRQLGIDAGQGYLLGRPNTVIDAGRVDLDALAGGPPPAPSDGAPGSPNADPRMRWGVAPRRVTVATVGTPAPLPTAASVIAQGAPNPFAQG
jgi:diguanylate cyclase (GGDEF)-like protein